MQREPIYNALFEKLSNLRNLTSQESYTIPASPYKIYVMWAGRFVSDVSVKNAQTGETFTKIDAGTPTSGEYLVNDNGTYTFAEDDSGTRVTINYIYKGIINAYLSLSHWNDVSPDEMPALFLVPKTETNTATLGLPPRWQIDVDVYLYVNAPKNPTFSPSQLINPLLDEIESLISIDNFSTNACTLDGLVSHAWISGQILRGEGRISTSEIAIVPINILVPA